MTYEDYLLNKRSYQELGSLLLLERKHACLFYKPGKGKTYPCIDAIRDVWKSKGNINLLILSTADAIKHMWLEEIMPQNILPDNTVYMTFNSAIVDATKIKLMKVKWDIIVIDECVPGNVEVLTDKGYKRFDELDKTELIAQYTDDGKIEFVKPYEFVEQNYDDVLYNLNFKNGYTLPMSKNHVQPFVLNGEICEHYASEMYHSSASSLIFAGKGNGSECQLSTLERLAIAMQADGSICHTNATEKAQGRTRWSVNLRKQRKIDLLNEYLDVLGIESKFWKNGTVQTFLLPNTITKLLSDTFDYTKFSYDKARAFIDEVCEWDGWTNGNNVDYKSIIKENADFVSAVAVLAGYCTHVIEVNDSRFKLANTQYRVCMTDTAIRNCQTKHWTTEKYKGKVYCVKVPSNKIVIRSDGYTMITGNCHKIKANNSKISKLCHMLTKKAEYVFGLSGTPRGNSDIDIFCQFHNMHISEWGDIAYTNFINNCCDIEQKFFGRQMVKIPIGINQKYRAGWERNIAMYTQRVGYDEADGMPELNVNVVRLPYTPTKEYLQAEQGVVDVPDYETTMTKLAAIQKLHQAVNGFLYLTDEVEDKRQVWHIERNKKLDWLDEHLTDDPTVIVYRFAEDLNELKREFGLCKWTEDIETFKSGEANLLFLQCSRCESFNLQMCNRIIFYTLDYSYIKYNQMLHRVWRMGQHNPVQIDILIFDNTVESNIWSAVSNKEKLADLFMSIKGM